MLEKLLSAIPFTRQNRIKVLMREHGICGAGRSLVIHGLLVSEFGYLLRHYSGGELDSFSNLSTVTAHANTVLLAMEADYENPRESQVLCDLKTAQANLDNLRGIMGAILAYVRECGRLGLDPQQTLEFLS